MKRSLSYPEKMALYGHRRTKWVRSVQCTLVAVWPRDSSQSDEHHSSSRQTPHGRSKINALSFSVFPSCTQIVALACVYAHRGAPCARTASS